MPFFFFLHMFQTAQLVQLLFCQSVLPPDIPRFLFRIFSPTAFLVLPL